MFPHLFPFPWIPYFIRHNIKIKLVHYSTIASKCSTERKSHTALTLNQKLEIIKHSEEVMLKAEIGQKLGFLYQTVSQVVNKMEKFLKEIKSTIPVNTQMVRKLNRLIANIETVLEVWREDQTSHNIPLS